MQAAADRVSIDACEIHRLSPNTLTSERSIAVDHHGQNFFFTAHANLLGSHTSGCDRIDGFEMTRVRDQVEINRLTIAASEGSRCALVILDIPPTKHTARIDVLKLGEHVRSGFADRVHHHVEPPAMAHCNYHLHSSALGCVVQDFVKKGNKSSYAFERKTLRAQIARLDHLLEQVCLGQEFEYVFLIYRCRFCLKALLNPLALRWIRNMHELSGNRAAVVTTSLIGEVSLNIELGDHLGSKILA